MPTCAILSFRLGLTDGVSVVALRWQQLLTELGFDVVTVAGEGPVDRTVPGLALRASTPPTLDELRVALADVDLVVVENLCTIPLNLGAARWWPRQDRASRRSCITTTRRGSGSSGRT